MVLTAASINSGSKPSSAQSGQRLQDQRFNLICICGCDPFHASAEGRLAQPMLRPPPVTSSPRPESTNALRSGEAWVPIRAYESTFSAMVRVGR